MVAATPRAGHTKRNAGDARLRAAVRAARPRVGVVTITLGPRAGIIPAVSRAMVHFVGGGPGAPDLLTVRGARAIAAADVVVWGRSLLMEEAVTEHARPDAELLPWPPLSAEELLAVYDRARDEDLVVARLHSGDPAIFGRIQEETRYVSERGLAYEIVPGVSSLAAAAAALGRELTVAGPPLGEEVASAEALDALIVARGGGRPPGLGVERVRELARHGATMAVFMAASDPDALQAALLRGGFVPQTPCAVASRLSWPDELVFTCRLDELAERTHGHDLDHRTLALVAPALDDAGAQADTQD